MNTQTIMGLLRNVAEVDPNDVIANAASQLAVDLELPNKAKNLTETEQQLIRYAHSKRNQYQLLPGQRHAIDTQRAALLAQ
jgi:sugar/nucleoside kinase (ribokinase family)